MTRKKRRASTGGGGAKAPGAPSRPSVQPKKTITDPIAFYRSLAAPSTPMRMVLIAGLTAYVIAQLVALSSSSKNLNTASSFALAGMAGILVFLGSGFVRHQRALFRIRRENPEAWNASFRFAMSTLPIPLGFGGRPADARERLLRRITLLLLLAFAVTAIVSSSKR